MPLDNLWYNIVTTHTKHGAFAFLDAVYHNKNVMGKQPLSFGQCPVVCVVTTAKTKGAFCMNRSRTESGRYGTEYIIPDKKVIELYVNNGMSVQQISKILSIGTNPLYKRLRELGVMRSFGETRKLNHSTSGENNPNWRGGKYVHGGYVMIWIDGKHVYEHRFVAERKLGRKLKAGEVVHHIDKNKLNNSPENIVVFSSNGEHIKSHMTSEEARKRGKNGGRKK